MIRLLRESGVDIKAEDARTGKMHVKREDEWRPVPGTLAQHLRFHPYAVVLEIERVPGLSIEP